MSVTPLPPESSEERRIREQQDIWLQGLHREVLNEPAPVHLQEAARAIQSRHRSAMQWTRMGGWAASVAFAFIMGWVAQPLWSTSAVGFSQAARGTPLFAQQALAAHAVFTPEVRHPVEVGPTEQQHLVQWLSKRVGKPLAAPDLQTQGFQLMGGRLLSAESGARAQMMFENAAGKRLTLYVGGLPISQTPASASSTGFQLTQQGRNLSFYWVDQNFGYALTGELDRQTMLALAEAVYAQLPR